jgi:pantetheine-phosphate adenylyltransferase
MSKRIAVFPGSFDPITVGHVDIVRRAMPLFDEIIIGIGDNTNKKYFFSIEDREAFIRKVFTAQPSISVKRYYGLTIDFCREQNAEYILRGLRTSADFEFERAIAQNNRAMSGIETIFIVSDPQFSHISSTIVRDILLHKGNASQFVPEGIL